jgi:hypothetical protein
VALTSFACAGDPPKGRTQNPPPPEEDAEAPPPRKLDARAADRAPNPPMPDAGATDMGGGAEAGAGPMSVDNPLGTPPMDLKDVGIFTAYPDVSKIHARAFQFAPKHELWSNGLSKSRQAVLPADAKIDTSNRDAWDFPVGSMFFKTFGTTDATGKLTPIETRVIRRLNKTAEMIHEQWDFQVYEWNAAGTAATLLDLKKRVPREVMVPINNVPTKITHNIPRLADCWNCHVANKATIIGFDELRLAWKSPTATGATLLADVMGKGWLTVAPTPPYRAVTGGRFPEETAALEYLQGNCAHCHNGEDPQEPGARYKDLDLRFDKAVRSTVNVAVMSVGSKQGIRIVPGMPNRSILLEAVEAIGNPMADPEVKPMPTVGVDKMDPKASMVLRAWIAKVTPLP